MGNIPDTSQLRKILKDIRISPQNQNGHQKQGKSEKTVTAKEAYGDMLRKCNAVSWVVSWSSKRYFKKNKKT